MKAHRLLLLLLFARGLGPRRGLCAACRPGGVSMSDRLTPETCSFVLIGRSSVTVVQTCHENIQR